MASTLQPILVIFGQPNFSLEVRLDAEIKDGLMDMKGMSMCSMMGGQQGR